APPATEPSAGARGEPRTTGRAAVIRSIGSPTRAGGFLFVGVVAPTATSIRVGGHATEHQRLFVKPGSERPLYTAVHLREPSTFQRALAPAPGPATLLGRPSGLHRFQLGTVRHQPGLHISPPPRS